MQSTPQKIAIDPVDPIAGEHIERDQECWEATTELCSMKRATVTKLRCMAFQRRLVPVAPQVETTLDILAKNVPNNLDKIRKQETTMRKLIAMYERGS